MLSQKEAEILQSLEDVIKEQCFVMESFTFPGDSEDRIDLITWFKHVRVSNHGRSFNIITSPVGPRKELDQSKISDDYLSLLFHFSSQTEEFISDIAMVIYRYKMMDKPVWYDVKTAVEHQTRKQLKPLGLSKIAENKIVKIVVEDYQKSFFYKKPSEITTIENAALSEIQELYNNCSRIQKTWGGYLTLSDSKRDWIGNLTLILLATGFLKINRTQKTPSPEKTAYNRLYKRFYDIKKDPDFS